MAWVREFWGIGLVLSCSLGVVSAGGCSEGGDPNDSDAAGGDAGRSGSSGNAGSSGSSGSAGRGGSAGSAGSAGQDGGGTGGFGGGCTPHSDETQCFQCARTNCCVEFLACGEAAVCGRDGGGEFPCVLSCMQNHVADGGVPDDDACIACSNSCASDAPAIDPITNELINCLKIGERTDGATGADCFVECFD